MPREGDLRYGLIAECELAVIAVCIVAWAKLSIRQFFLMGSDNMNATAWKSHGKAKQGTAMRLLYFLFWYCITYDIDFFSFTISSGRNIAPDFLSRAADSDVATWPQRYEMAQIALTWRRSGLIKMGPSRNWGEDLTAFLREIHIANHFDWNLRIAERGHANGILPNLLQSQGLIGRVTHFQSKNLLGGFGRLGFFPVEGTEQCVCGRPSEDTAGD